MTNRPVIKLVFAIGILVGGWCSPLLAQSPELGYVFPPFVERDRPTVVVLGGYDFTPDMQFLVHQKEISLETSDTIGPFLVIPRPYWAGPRIFSSALPIPREVAGVITPMTACPAGPISWQIANANGISRMSLFYVSEITEVVENRFRDQVMNLEKFPLGVSGRLSRLTEKDAYAFVAGKTGSVYLELWARRLGSNFNAAIQVYAEDGSKLLDEVDTEGRDLTVEFAVSKGSRYEIHLHDADFRGAAQFVYRMLLQYHDPQQQVGAQRRWLRNLTDTVQLPLDLLAGREYRIRAQSQAIGGDLDLQLELLDDQGQVLAENDDAGPQTVDAQVRYMPKADAALVARISASSVTGAKSRFFYDLDVSVVQRGFNLTVAQTVPGKLGEKISLPVELQSYGGFNEDVKLKIVGLPAGVTVQGDPVVAAGKNKASIGLAVAKDANVQAVVIQVVGESSGDPAKGWAPLSVVATAPRTGSLAVTDPDLWRTPDVVLGVIMTAPFKLQVVDKERQRVVHRGTTYPAPLKVVRDDGYKGVIRLMMKSQQARHRMGMRAPVLEVAPDVQDVLYPCFMPEWLATDRTSRMVVLAFGEVPDPQGQLRHVGVGADARITMILEGALLKLGSGQLELQTRAGKPFEIPVEILRTSKLQTPVRIDLELDADLAPLIHCESVVLEVGESRTVLKLKSESDQRLRGVIPITVRATAREHGQWEVKSLQDVEVLFE